MEYLSKTDRAIEAVVQPWNHRTHDEEGDAAIVEPAVEAADFRRMTGQGVEKGGAG